MRLLGPLIHSGQLFQWLATNQERGAAPVETHIVVWTVDPIDTVEWLRWRGYRAVVGAGWPKAQGVVFSRKNEPAMIAAVGDTLVWDGQNVVIKED